MKGLCSENSLCCQLTALPINYDAYLNKGKEINCSCSEYTNIGGHKMGRRGGCRGLACICATSQDGENCLSVPEHRFDCNGRSGQGSIYEQHCIDDIEYNNDHRSLLNKHVGVGDVFVSSKRVCKPLAFEISDNSTSNTDSKCKNARVSRDLTEIQSNQMASSKCCAFAVDKKRSTTVSIYHSVGSLPLLTTVSSLLVVFQLLLVGVSGSPHTSLDMCEPIQIPMCTGMRYNMTRMPNHLHHSTQENARLAIEPYGELVKQNCSADILFFLCAMFAPICTPHFQKEAIPPCRSVCERSRRGCEPLMNKYNFSWPEDLDCERLPEYDKGVCVSPEAIVASTPEDDGSSNQPVPPPREETKRHIPRQECKCKGKNKPKKSSYKAGRFHYAISGEIKTITIFNDTTSVVGVLVNHVLQRGKVHIQEQKVMHLWSESPCVCPELRTSREYLIIGHEEVMLNRLKFGEDTLVTRWNPKWAKKFMSWRQVKGSKGNNGKKRKDKNKRRRCKNPKSRSCRKKNRVRCRVEQKDETKTRVKCTRPKLNKKRNRKKNKKNRKRNSLKTKTKNNDTDLTETNTVTNKAGR